MVVAGARRRTRVGLDWCLVQQVRVQPVSAGRLPPRHQWGSATPPAVVAGLADVGVLLWLMSEICLGGIFTSGTAIEVSTTVYLSAGAVTLALAGGLRSKVRTLSVVEVDRRPERSAAMYAEWETLVGLLADADALREQGRLSAIDHDAVWRRVYDRLGPGRPHTLDEQPSI